MPNLYLDQRCLDRLKPRTGTFAIRDTELRGFGVSVYPSGTIRYFVQSQHNRVRVWHQLGDACKFAPVEARRRARSILATIQNGGEPATADPEQTRFEVVATRRLDSCQRHWKAGTRTVNGSYFWNQIPPWFRDMQVADITGRDVNQWHSSLHATPFVADRSAPVLSALMRQAELHGYRPEGSNPCVGISTDVEGASVS